MTTVKRTATALFCSVILAGANLKAQTLDTVIFGNSSSESNHALATDFPTVTPASVVTAGGGTSPTDPPTTAPSTTVTGALGLTARQLLPRSPNPDIYGGEMSFTMTVDPVKQNFFTVKFWGADTSTQWLVLDCNGKEVGWRHLGADQEIFYSSNTYAPGWFSNRFIYRTAALPLNLTQGQTSVTIMLRSLGWIAYYDGSGLYFGHYQNLMNAASPNLYSAYTHTSGFFDYSGETQGTAPTVVTPLTTPTQATEMSKWQSQLNSEVTTLLAASPGSFTADNVDFLAQSYGVSTSNAYQSTAALNQIIAAIDAMVTAYSAAPTTYMGSFGNPSWGGYFGPVGDAIRLLWPQLSSGSTLSTTVAYGGVIGTATRTQAWSTALRASIDYGRYNRRGITNQELACTANIYKANRGLELVDPSNALNESEALRYPHEACGLSPWLGNDQPTGGTDGFGGGPVPTYGTSPNGPNWYMVTSKGTTKEDDFVGSDYGEQGCNVYDLGILANDGSLMAQGLKMLRARAYFRTPGIDSHGYLAMFGTDAIGARNDEEIDRATHVAYLGLAQGEIQTASLGASVIGTDLMGYMQQHITDGQFFAELAEQDANTSGAPYVPGYVTSIMAQPQTGIKLPETSGQPDFAWGDEENMVVAAKHGSGSAEERFYANLNWRTVAIDGIAKIFRQTATTANIAEVTCDDVQFQPSGQTVRGSSLVDTGFTPPDNPINAYGGVPWLVALRSDLTTVPPTNQDGGRAWGYTLRYGNWLVGINGNSSQNYTMKLPGGFTSAIDLVSGNTLTAPIVLSPKTTVVFYLSTTTDSNPTPSAPTYVTASGTLSQMAVNWNATTGATSYIVQRAYSAAGPFTTLASGITGTTYTDTSGLIDGADYYYQVIPVNAAGQGNPSPAILAEAGLISPWVNADIGTVAVTGSSLYQNGVFTVAGSGSDIGSTSDSFQFAYVPLTGDGTITARVTSITGATSSSKIGVMMRETLTSGSRHVSLLLESGGTALIVGSRSATNGNSVYQTHLSGSVPLWLRMTRAGNVFTAYQSPDGVNWTVVDTPVTITMNNAISVGLACCSRNGTESGLANTTFGQGLVYTTFDNLSAPGWTPPVAPAAPASLSTTAGEDNVTLTWNASTGATSYNVYRSTTSGSGYTPIANGVTTTAYTDSSVTNGTTYYYVVTAVNSTGESAASSEVGATPIGQVTGVGASVNNDLVSLTWNADPGATSYAVGRSTTNGGPYTTIASGITTTSYSDTSVSDGTTYYYEVTAANSGGAGASSAVYSTTPVAPPAMPVGLTATPGDSQATVNWTAVSGAVGYNIKRATVSGGPYTTVGTPTTAAYTDSGLTDNTTYYYVVSAVNPAGESANSAEVSVQPSNQPLNLVATAGNAQVALTWTASYGSPLSYNVYRSTASGSGYAQIATGLTTTAYTDSSVTNGTTDYYVVTAVYSYGEGSQSAQVSAQPMPPLPVAPTGFAAVGGTGQIALSWNATSYAASYNVKRGTTSGGPYTTIASPPGTSYTDAGLASGATYYYVVTAVNLSGESGASSEVNATTAPGAVTGVTAAPGNAQVALNWTAAPGAATYSVGRSTVSGGPYTTIASGGATTGYLDTGLANGTTYYYVVTAVNTGGTGPNSAEASAEPLPPLPMAPTGLATTSSNGQIAVTWSATTYATNYIVGRSTNGGGPYTTVATTAGTNYIDTGLTNGTTYYYVVAAADLAGTGPNSAQTGAEPLPPIPSAPTGLTATAGNSQVSLIWSSATYATSYVVGRSTNSGGPYTTVATPAGVSYTDTGVTNGTTYYYVVAAVDLAGSGPNSAQASAEPLPPQPTAPTGLAATPGITQIRLTWNPVSVATSYNVKISTTSGGPYSTVANVTTTNLTDTGLANAAAYYFVVSALNSAGESANSAQVSTTPLPPPPAAPTGLVGDGWSGKNNLSWNASSGATSYSVLRATLSGGPFSTIASGLTGTTYTDSTAVNGTTYYYEVTASDLGGPSTPSTPVNVTTIAPKACLKFDEGTGTTTVDASGNGWNGTLVNAPTWVAGRSFNAVYLNGTNNYISLPAGVVNGLTNCTIALWVYVDSAGTSARLFDFGTGTTKYMYVTANNGSGAFRFGITTGGVNKLQRVDAAKALPLGGWHHVAVTLAGSVGTLYVDGAQVGQNTALTLNPSSLGSTTQNWIGRSETSGNPYLGGVVDEFRIYPLALSATQIASLMNGDPLGLQPAPTNLVATAGTRQVALTWTAAPGAISYDVLRATTSTGTYTTVATNVTAISYTNTGLTTGATYYYAVMAVSATSESPNSNQASVKSK